MAIFVPGLAGASYVEHMIQASEELLRSGEVWPTTDPGFPWESAWIAASHASVT